MHGIIQHRFILYVLILLFRLRLKKEFDDYKKHPEYNNFVREEGFSSSTSSSSSDEEKDEERGLDAKVYSLSDHYRRSEEEDLEVPRGLWKGGKTFRRWFVRLTVLPHLMVLHDDAFFNVCSKHQRDGG